MIVVLYGATIFAEEKKPWTFMVYMEANNDLDIFAPKNIDQMKSVGSNHNINIIAHMHTRENKGNKRKTIFIKEKESILLEEKTDPIKNFDHEKDLVEFCTKTIQKYPAEHYALIFWNHGTGALDPNTRFYFSASQLFSLSGTQEMGKSALHAPSMCNLKQTLQQTKGICFDDKTGNFLTEQKLCSALKTITQQALHEKKLSLVGFDACLMSMIEVASALKDYVEIMVGSQEVELGTGWNYARALAPFLFGTISPKTFGVHIVQAYAKTYASIADYTQSAIDLSAVSDIESNISKIAQHIIQIKKKHKEINIKKALKISRSKHFCTHFDEPSFVDLHHLYENIITNINESSHEIDKSNTLVANLKNLLHEGCTLIKKAVLANKTGPKHIKAQGLSVYFPEHGIHSSYRKNRFVADNESWLELLYYYHSC